MTQSHHLHAISSPRHQSCHVISPVTSSVPSRHLSMSSVPSRHLSMSSVPPCHLSHHVISPTMSSFHVISPDTSFLAFSNNYKNTTEVGSRSNIYMACKKHKGIVLTDKNSNTINDDNVTESDHSEITGVDSHEPHTTTEAKQHRQLQ